MNIPSLFRSNDVFWQQESFRRLAKMQRDMDRLFADFSGESPTIPSAGAAIPACDVEEAGDHYVMSMDMPGLKKDDIKIELRGDQLFICGERREEKEERKKNTLRSERLLTSYARTFSLPEGVKAENIETEYKDGVLRVALPKGGASQTKQIKVSESKPGFFDRLFRKDAKSIEVEESNRVA